MQHVHRRATERFVWLLAVTIAALGLLAAQSVGFDAALIGSPGANPCDQGNAGASNPNCQDGEFTPPEDDDDGDDDADDPGAPGEPGEPGTPAVPASCTEFVEALADGGAPAELTDGLQTLCDAIEGDDGSDPNEPGDPAEGNLLSDGCQELIDALSEATAEEVGELGAVCDALGELPLDQLPLDEVPLPLGLG